MLASISYITLILDFRLLKTRNDCILLYWVYDMYQLNTQL